MEWVADKEGWQATRLGVTFESPDDLFARVVVFAIRVLFVAPTWLAMEFFFLAMPSVYGTLGVRAR